ISWLALIAYFAIAESWWGRGLGKLLLGLRVVGVSGEPVGLHRTLLRSFVIPGACGVSLAGSYLMPSASVSGPMDGPQALGLIGITIIGYVPLLLCLITMRARNGYRG